MSPITLDSESPRATHEIGCQLGSALSVGHIVALVGPLGSGKTTLVKGIADGAGVADLRQVNSPTFVIVNEYDSEVFPPLRIYHIDAYRLSSSSDLEALGFDEMCIMGAVIVEWADRVVDLLPADVLALTIEPIGVTGRRFHCWATGPASRRSLAALAGIPSRRTKAP